MVRVVLSFLLLLGVAFADGQQPNVFTTTGTGNAVNNIGSGTQYHKLTWTKTGTVTVCSVQIDSSADNLSWGNGDVLGAQDCSTNGTATSTAHIVNYTRVHVTSFTGTGSVSIPYNLYINNPAGGGGGGITNGAAANVIPKSDGTNIVTSLLDDGSTTANTLTYSGSGGFATTGALGSWLAKEGTAPSGSANNDICWADSTAHRFKCNNNNGGATTLSLFTDNLSVFAATTSAQFLGVISDEVGTGSKVAKFDSVSGNSGVAAQSSGALVSGNCAKFDASGNIVDAATTCGGGAGTAASVLYPDSASTTGTAADQVVASASINPPGAGKCVAIDFNFIDFSGTGTYNLKLKLGSTTSSAYDIFAAGSTTNNAQHIVLCNKSAVQNAQFYLITGNNAATGGFQNGQTANVSFATEDWSTAKTIAIVINASATANWRSGGGVVWPMP